jgi:hypothetical protein
MDVGHGRGAGPGPNPGAPLRNPSVLVSVLSLWALSSISRLLCLPAMSCAVAHYRRQGRAAVSAGGRETLQTVACASGCSQISPAVNIDSRSPHGWPAARPGLASKPV